ncbi:MAG: hypothetical protein ACQKBY_03760 [Verrucomicrobiales bacterium]
MKGLAILLAAVGSLLALSSCGSSGGSVVGSSGGGWFASRQETAQWLIDSPRVRFLNRQVSGRRDGASAMDNIKQAAGGSSCRCSYYGRAPGGRVELDEHMLTGMKKLALEGYSFRVTSVVGGSHSRNSKHYAGLAFDVDTINGARVNSGNRYYRRFMQRARALGATELKGPGDRGHSTHVHLAWPRR